MSLDLHECSRCMKYLHSYSGEHLCPTCAEILGRSTHDLWWGDFASHPDRSDLAKLADEALEEARLRDRVERDLRRTIEIMANAAPQHRVTRQSASPVSRSRPSGRVPTFAREKKSA